MTVLFYSNFLALSMGYLLPFSYIACLIGSLVYDYINKVSWTIRSMLCCTFTCFCAGMIFRYGNKNLDLQDYEIEDAVILYTMSLAVYHVGEYLATAYFHPNKVTWESFLINHSTEYGVAILASYIELGSKFVLAYYFDIAALMRLTMHIGLLMICVGHLFRLGGLISGGTNFTHKIRWKNEPTHQLVIGGFFAICRHPGYFGWYIWSVGTQILVLNPVCILGFAKAARDFFSSRIEAEEYSLHERFGGDYMNYTKAVPRFPLKLDALMLSR